VRALLTPKPFRGDVIAAGVVVLTTLVWTLGTRFADGWPPGVHLAYSAVAFAFVGAMALLAPMEGATPRAYQSVLYLATLALWVATLQWVFAATDADLDHVTSAARTVSVGMVAVASLAFGLAIARNSAACTLVGALTGGVGLLAVVVWAFQPEEPATYRWIGVAEMAIFGVAAVGQRDRRPRHAVALIDAAGVAAVAIGASLAFWFSLEGDQPRPDRPWGWELLILATGFGLIAYSSVDRQPGPAYLGVINLILFTAIATDAGPASFLGWPLVLALAAFALLAVGLRPTTPAPPPPDVDAPEPPPLPLR
jgi:hypothetical protein